MNKRMTTALAAAAVMLLLAVFALPASAAGPVLTATRAYCIMDAETGLVLAEQNMNERLHPASTTKVMTLGLACEKAAGSWDVDLTVSHEDTELTRTFQTFQSIFILTRAMTERTMPRSILASFVNSIFEPKI